MDKKELKIVFMGTPEFAAESLKALKEADYNIVGVITAPDKPAGRGKKIRQSAVKKYALEHEMHIMQPKNLKAPEFISELKDLGANLQIVVAFRMLPEVVWAMPKFGTINLHASLLPQYRGAAPITHAIINGESKTGVTTFFIEKEIDTGKIIMQEEVEIQPEENAGQLHDKLMITGSKLILKTVEALYEEKIQEIPQKDLLNDTGELKSANKIFKEDCKINWNQDTNTVFNFIRGLSPYPGAWMTIKKEDLIYVLKIYTCGKEPEDHSLPPGKIITDNRNILKISTTDGFLHITELQLEGKKRMKTKDLLNGFDISGYENE